MKLFKKRSALVINTNPFVSDELASIMKKLSLEKYNPIFEEQEVSLNCVLNAPIHCKLNEV